MLAKAVECLVVRGVESLAYSPGLVTVHLDGGELTGDLGRDGLAGCVGITDPAVCLVDGHGECRRLDDYRCIGFLYRIGGVVFLGNDHQGLSLGELFPGGNGLYVNDVVLDDLDADIGTVTGSDFDSMRSFLHSGGAGGCQ